MFLHIWTVILMYYVYGNKIIIVIVIDNSPPTYGFVWNHAILTILGKPAKDQVVN